MRRLLFALITLASLGHAQIAIVSGAHAKKGGSGATPAINTTGATEILVFCQTYGATPTLTDSKSNSWSSAGATTGSGYAGTQKLFYANSAIVGSSHTFTCAGGQYPAVAVLAVSGTGAGANNDGSCTVSNQPSTNYSTLTPSQAGDIFVGLGGSAYGGDTGPFTLSPNFTTSDSQHDGTNSDAGLAYYINAGTTAQNPNWDGTYSNDSNNWSGLLCAFKQGSSAGASPTIVPGTGT